LGSKWYLTTIRHGETDYNRENRYAGTIDVPLNEAGRNDARDASIHIRSMHFDVSVVSPLSRAIETAEILTEGRIQIIPCPYARERNYGMLQGLTSADVERIRPPIHFIKVGDDYHSLDPPQAEAFEDLRERAEAFFQYVNDHFMGKNVLVVSHGVFLQQLHGLLRGQDWIEALDRYVGNLELMTFYLEGSKVVAEDLVQLMKRKQIKF
jgi:2,3-bisphosphoglycerate-dependent phosphoglycerate mutase